MSPSLDDRPTILTRYTSDDEVAYGTLEEWLGMVDAWRSQGRTPRDYMRDMVSSEKQLVREGLIRKRDGLPTKKGKKLLRWGRRTQ